MKKALLLALAIVACCFLIGNADTIAEIYNTAQTGATIPLLVACVIMIARHVTQAISYKASFEAVGFSGHRLWEYIVLIFSLVFINTFCLFSGATGVAFIVDDAHRKGADLGKATSGAILSQIGYFSALLVISIIGFLTMVFSNSVNPLFLMGALLLAGTLLGLSSLYVIGYARPQWLYGFFRRLAVPLGAVATRIRRPLAPSWASDTADSFVKSALVMAQNPGGTFLSVGWASLSALLNMSSLIAIGFAFGFENVVALIAAFALAAISVILSPTPQGIGVVEAAIAAMLTAYGCSLPTATAIALLYRGIMFWIPFCIGAVLLSQSGFFQGKKDPSYEQKDKDIAWIFGTSVGIVGLVSIALYFVPTFLAPYQALVKWVDFSNVFVGPAIVLYGVLLLFLAFGLVKRYRTCMALTVTILLLMAGVQFLFFETITVAVVCVALAVALFVKRSAFDRPMHAFLRRK